MTVTLPPYFDTPLIPFTPGTRAHELIENHYRKAIMASVITPSTKCGFRDCNLPGCKIDTPPRYRATRVRVEGGGIREAVIDTSTGEAAVWLYTKEAEGLNNGTRSRSGYFWTPSYKFSEVPDPKRFKVHKAPNGKWGVLDSEKSSTAVDNYASWGTYALAERDATEAAKKLNNGLRNRADYIWDALKDFAPVPAFKADEAEVGAKVKLTAKTGPAFSAEVTIAEVITEGGKVTAIRAEVNGSKISASDYDLVVIEAAGPVLPTTRGLYVIEKDAEDIDLGDVNVYGLYGGTWTRYIAGDTSVEKVTAAELRKRAKGSKLVEVANPTDKPKAAPAPRFKAINAKSVTPGGHVQGLEWPGVLDTVTGKARLFPATSDRNLALGKLNSGARAADYYIWRNPSRFKTVA